MRNLVIVAIALFISASCSSKDSVVETQPTQQDNDTTIALRAIQESDSLLRIAYTTSDTIPTQLIEEAIEIHKRFAHQFPEHSFAPDALDKIHYLYAQTGKYSLSVEYGELILKNYPKYAKINQVIYSLATSYDFMLSNNDKALVLYEKLIDSDHVTKETKEEIKERIKQLKK